MLAKKADRTGRRIVDVNFHRFPTRPDKSNTKDGTDPILTLDNGRKIWFVTQETEDGEYGHSICID